MPPPRRGNIRLNIVDLKAAGLPASVLEKRIILERVVVESAMLVSPASLAPIWVEDIGTSLTVAETLEIAVEIEQVYRRSGYLVIAAVPDQDFASGTLRIVMFEQSFISTVEFLGDQRRLEQRLQPYIQRIVAMQPLRIEEIERILLLMADLAGLTVTGTLTRPEIPGTGGTLTVEVELESASGRFLFNNRGDDDVGPLQFIGQLGINDAFGLLESTDILGVTVPDTPRELLFGQISQDIPISTRGLSLRYAVSRVRSRPGGELAELDVDISTTATSLGLRYPVVRTIGKSLFASVDLFTKDNSVSVLNRLNSRDRTRWVELAFDTSHDGPVGEAEFNASLVLGLDILGATPRGGPLSVRPDAGTDFSAIRADALLRRALSDRLTVTGRATGHYGATVQPNATRFSFGGEPFGRAFEDTVMSGDSGFALSAEISARYPVDSPFMSALIPFVFTDYGAVWDRRGPNRATATTLGSIGAGIRAGLAYDTALEGILAAPIKTADGIADPGLSAFFSLRTVF